MVLELQALKAESQVTGCKREPLPAMRPLMGEIFANHLSSMWFLDTAVAQHGTALIAWCLPGVLRGQADIVILTNDNPRDVPPEDIVSDTVAGYSELVLKHNVLECSPTSPGFLQDPGRVEWTSLPFYWDACYQCAFESASPVLWFSTRVLRHADRICLPSRVL